MEFKKMFIVVTLAIMTTTFVGCGSEENPPDSDTTQALSSDISSDISSDDSDESSHSSFWSPFLGSFIGSWLGNSMSRDHYYDNDRNRNTQPVTTAPANNKSTKIQDIQPPSTTNKNTTDTRVKGSVSPDKSITNSTGKTTGKTGIGSGGARSGSVSKAAS